MSAHVVSIWGLPVGWLSSSRDTEVARRRDRRAASAQHKPRRSISPLIPALCEVCRKRPVTTIVVDFIFASSLCAKKIETAIRHPHERSSEA